MSFGSQCLKVRCCKSWPEVLFCGGEGIQTLQRWSLLFPAWGVGGRYVEAHVPAFDTCRCRLLINTPIFSPTCHFHILHILLPQDQSLTWDPLGKSTPFLLTSLYDLTFYILPQQIALFWPFSVFQNFVESSHPLMAPLLFFFFLADLYAFSSFTIMLVGSQEREEVNRVH